ncbi:MAG: DUF1800 domain-containing protein [Planctomycetes bacterium]|nr:DUF1800 domain-containing protein [Planctomycetota bacterium]
MATISSLKALRPADFDYWKAHHLLNRAGFGGTPQQVRALANLGLDDAVDHLVAFHEVEAPRFPVEDFDPDIMQPPPPERRQELRQARQRGDEAVLEQARRERQMRQRADRKQMASFQREWLRFMIESPRPLEEKMTLFWHGHFATGYRAIEDSRHMVVQNDLFRSQAVGNFRSLTHAIIHDPAMLRYLNNNQNRRQKPNENLARELMELFTLGEGHAYTEQDIKEGARALTGYTYVDDDFRYAERMHDPGEKRILGRVGKWDGDDFVDIILSKPHVSEYICLKLYRFFVNDLPTGPDRATQQYIKRLAKKFRDAKYDVAPVLRTILRSAHFYDAPNVASQIKSPTQLVVQTIRSLHTPTRSLSTLLGACDLMGQNIGYPPSVKGWDGGRSWINTATLFVRQNIVLYLITGRHPEGEPWDVDGQPYDATPIVEHLEAAGTVEPRSAIVYLTRFLLGTEAHEKRLQTLLEFVERSGGRIDAPTLVGLLALIAAMPEYQLC